MAVPRTTIVNMVNQKCSLRNGQWECNEPKKKSLTSSIIFCPSNFLMWLLLWMVDSYTWLFFPTFSWLPGYYHLRCLWGTFFLRYLKAPSKLAGHSSMFGFKYVTVCGGRSCYFLYHITWHNLWVMLYTWNSEQNLYGIFFKKNLFHMTLMSWIGLSPCPLCWVCSQACPTWQHPTY
jgi:hypothetical protein